MLDKSLINRCLKNDRKAYEELYNLTLPNMVMLCRKYRLQETDMEDMIQEIYCEMFISLHKYDERRGPFLPWFKKLGLFTILKGFRKNKMKIIELDHNTLGIQEESLQSKKLNENEILAIVDKLPLGYKTIFNLAKDGYDHSEISKYLGISKSTSRSQLARAKQMLRNQITNLNRISI